MSVAAIGPAHVMPAATGRERTEGPGPDHDGDSDDVGAAKAVPNASPAPGTGQSVDKTA